MIDQHITRLEAIRDTLGPLNGNPDMADYINWDRIVIDLAEIIHAAHEARDDAQESAS